MQNGIIDQWQINSMVGIWYNASQKRIGSSGDIIFFILKSITG